MRRPNGFLKGRLAEKKHTQTHTHLGEIYYFISLKQGGWDVGGLFPHKPPFGVRSSEVVIIDPDHMGQNQPTRIWTAGFGRLVRLVSIYQGKPFWG